MPSILKIFRFRYDNAGWIATPAHAQVYMFNTNKYLHKRNTKHNAYPNISLLRGTLKTTGCSRIGSAVPDTTSYWSWSGTWADLGVPHHCRILSVSGTYWYRFKLRPERQAGRHGYYINPLTFGEQAAASGPFIIYGPSFSDSLSAEYFAPPLENAMDWHYYPSISTSTPLDPPSLQWDYAYGNPVSIPSSFYNSGDALALRLYSQLPSLYGDGFYQAYIALMQTRITLNIEYVRLAEKPLVLDTIDATTQLVRPLTLSNSNKPLILENIDA